MMIIYFFYGLAFGGLGLAAFLQLRRGGDFPLKQQLPWLAAFGAACAASAWTDMFLASNAGDELTEALKLLRMVLQVASGLALLKFGWGILVNLTPLPPWAIFIPGILIVPIAFVITYASTTFITPSPLEIPVDIWSRYLFYLPGSIMAGVGFLRQYNVQRRLGHGDVSNLMLGAGVAFLFEAFVVGLVVPAAPYGPASYYNYDRVAHNAFIGEQVGVGSPFSLMTWLDYDQVLAVTGLPIQFWRMLSAFAVTAFVVRGLGVFDAIQKRTLLVLQAERDRAQQTAYDAQIAARRSAESWTEALVHISRHIAELKDVDTILLYIVEQARLLLHADFVGLALLGSDAPWPELKCYARAERTALVEEPLLVTNAQILRALRTSQSHCSQAGDAPEGFDDVCFFPAEPARALAVVHLDLDSRPIGAFWLARAAETPFADTDLIWLECLADQVVIAIKHGLMTSQLQSVSVIEERGRIAREMHDGLAQVLGYLNLQVQTLETLLQQGKVEKLQTKLGQMREAVQVAHADVRENILSLRTTLANDKGLVPAIDEYLVEFGIQTHVETQFINELADGIELASVAEVQLVCILQEALSNVRKHAQATEVIVRLASEQRGGRPHVTLTVRDDGAGFRPGGSSRSFGLQTMRERAYSVNGEFSLTTMPQHGTEIVCRLPAIGQETLDKRSLVLD